MTWRCFSEEDVERLLDMPAAIAAMRDAFSALAEGRAHNVPRVRARGAGIVLHGMQAVADYLQLAGWKQYTTTRHGTQFHVGLYDQSSGEPLALISANRLGQLRTGAATALAVQLLRPGASRMGLFGSGWQAESQLEAVSTVCRLEQVLVYSRHAQRREQFAARMSERLRLDVTAVDRPQAAVSDLPLVVTATTSSQPVFEGTWLAAETMVCAVGANWLHKAEIDVTTIRRADLVVCDSVECCRQEAGDLAAAVTAGAIAWDQMVEMQDLVSRPTGEPTPGNLVFKSVGMAIEDVALGGLLLARATEQRKGRR